MSGLSVESMAKMMTSELMDGCLDDPTVKAGFIGEIGCCFPINGENCGQPLSPHPPPPPGMKTRVPNEL
jgi:hypothetical protein